MNFVTDVSGMTAADTLYARLTQVRQQMQQVDLSAVMRQADRPQECTQRLGPLYYDFTRQYVHAEALALLRAYARARGLPQWLRRISGGELVNGSEQRPAQHMALRDLQACLPDEAATLIATRQRERMWQLLRNLRDGTVCGARGQRFDTLVNIGVGGSHLGAAMAVHASQSFATECFAVHFISHLDGLALQALLPRLNVDRTLFLISSKTFSTLDTLENTQTAMAYMRCQGYAEAEIRRHFLGISASLEAMHAFGIPADLQLEFMPGIGGRFSMASTIGLPLAARIGEDGFMRFLAGMQMVDVHVLQEVEHSIPATMALLEWWSSLFWNTEAFVALPYHQHLALFPEYLMQLQMESLGKGCDLQGHALLHSGLMVFGGVGTEAQHSFMQLLHQGTHAVQTDFIMYALMPQTSVRQRDCTLANALAQGVALARGYPEDQAALDFPGELPTQLRARVHPGNRPSSTLLWSALTPETLGMLVALYEHKTILLAGLLGVNPFDQMGVELGKRLARSLLEPLSGCSTEGLDASTAALIKAVHALRAESSE